ncbi:MAG: ribosomal L7Ae/L30e/S12e/Gadd45 family protein [Clostridiales bacterium]|nr:ribosomal L7Ae/L30e/S12e/Gadd45 family protein [Clostridiales bacterium]
MTDELNTLKFLGLAARAGKVVSGFDQVTSCVRRGQAQLLIIATDISRNTLSKLLDVGQKDNVQLPDAFSFGTQYELGRAIGKPDRALIAITDKGFADKLSAMLQSMINKEDIH